jgi:phage protein D
MKRYWDSSALLDCLGDSRIEQQAREADQWTRPHSLAEMFSQLTGGRLGIRYVPDDAAAMIAEITERMNFVDLTRAEIQTALKQAQARGVRGGNVHDWLHAVAARKARVEVLLTDNFTDFEDLHDGFRIEPP